MNLASQATNNLTSHPSKIPAGSCHLNALTSIKRHALPFWLSKSCLIIYALSLILLQNHFSWLMILSEVEQLMPVPSGSTLMVLNLPPLTTAENLHTWPTDQRHNLAQVRCLVDTPVACQTTTRSLTSCIKSRQATGLTQHSHGLFHASGCPGQIEHASRRPAQPSRAAGMEAFARWSPLAA